MLLNLVTQKQKLRQNLIIIKVHTRVYGIKRKVLQQYYNEYYGQRDHNTIDDWHLILNEQFETQCQAHKHFQIII